MRAAEVGTHCTAVVVLQFWGHFSFVCLACVCWCVCITMYIYVCVCIYVYKNTSSSREADLVQEAPVWCLRL